MPQNRNYSKEDFFEKSRSLFKVAMLLYKNGFYNDSFSRLYYALRAFLRGICGEPIKSKWKHEALINCFIREFSNNNLSIEEKRLLRKMPSIRNKVDYEPIEISKEKLDIYIKLVKKIFTEFSNGS